MSKMQSVIIRFIEACTQSSTKSNIPSISERISVHRLDTTELFIEWRFCFRTSFGYTNILDYADGT